MKLYKDFWPNGAIKVMFLQNDLGQTIEGRFWTNDGKQHPLPIMKKVSDTIEEYININRAEWG